MLMRILAIVPTLRDDPTETVQSIIRQSVEISKILVVIGSKSLYNKLVVVKLERTEYIYVEPNFSQPLGKRVAVAINTALAKEVLEEYDYILKVDAETILPRDFVKENLKNLPDFIGSGGCAMLFKVSPFLKALGGKYPEVFADDTYLASKFLYEGYSVKRWLCSPQFKIREKGHHSYKHGLQRGIEWYKLGYEPVHVLNFPREFVYNVHNRTFKIDRFFPVIGYFLAALRRTKRYEFAPWIFIMQTRRLIYGRQFKY
jgi:hypothetical protein